MIFEMYKLLNLSLHPFVKRWCVFYCAGRKYALANVNTTSEVETTD